jgi:hypothetical protein
MCTLARMTDRLAVSSARATCTQTINKSKTAARVVLPVCEAQPISWVSVSPAVVVSPHECMKVSLNPTSGVTPIILATQQCLESTCSAVAILGGMLLQHTADGLNKSLANTCSCTRSTTCMFTALCLRHVKKSTSHCFP